MSGNTTPASLLYGFRATSKRPVLRPVQEAHPPLAGGLMILVSAGYNNSGLLAAGVAHCGADLLHYVDYRQGSKIHSPKDVDREVLQNHHQLQNNARARYQRERNPNLPRVNFPDLEPLFIASRPGGQAARARAFCYIEDATDYQSYRDSSAWIDDAEQALAMLLHVAQVSMVNIDSALRSMQQSYYNNLANWLQLELDF